MLAIVATGTCNDERFGISPLLSGLFGKNFRELGVGGRGGRGDSTDAHGPGRLFALQNAVGRGWLGVGARQLIAGVLDDPLKRCYQPSQVSHEPPKRVYGKAKRTYQTYDGENGASRHSRIGHDGKNYDSGREYGGQHSEEQADPPNQ